LGGAALKKKLQEYMLITFGYILVALAVQFFLLPNKIAGGGVTGIAIIINGLFPKFPVGFLMLAMNMLLFILALIVVGSKFGAKSFYAAVGYSGAVLLLNYIVPSGRAVTYNPLLAAIFGTLLSGVGMGIVFNQNASTGGTDIIAKIINRYFHLDIGKSLLLVDFSVTLFAGVAFSPEIGMYALLAVLINGFVIDNVIEGFNICKQVTIISKNNETITKYIIEELDRGLTKFHGTGGYKGEPMNIIYTVLSRREFIKLKKFLKETDEKAFIIVSDAREVLGEGFKNIIGED
jgi:uncharacterized membrane-anchored protein YitT (DUF2179 family)